MKVSAYTDAPVRRFLSRPRARESSIDDALLDVFIETALPVPVKPTLQG